MKVKKLEKFHYKIGLKGCKWSSLNAPGTKIPVSYAFRLPDSRVLSHNGDLRRESPFNMENKQTPSWAFSHRHQKCEMSTFYLRLGQAGLLGA